MRVIATSFYSNLLGDLETIPKQVGEPTTILVDRGYAPGPNMEQIEQVQQNCVRRGKGLLLNESASTRASPPLKLENLRYDFKAPKKRKPLVLKERRRQAMAERMASELIYTARKI